MTVSDRTYISNSATAATEIDKSILLVERFGKGSVASGRGRRGQARRVQRELAYGCYRLVAQ